MQISDGSFMKWVCYDNKVVLAVYRASGPQKYNLLAYCTYKINLLLLLFVFMDYELNGSGFLDLPLHSVGL